jgi:hypothetical protein
VAARLIVSFGSPELLAYCSRLDAAEELLGSAHAQALLALIADIEAHDDAAELIAFFGESAKVEGDSLWLKISANCHVRFVPIGGRVTRGASGCIRWATVQRFKLVEILKSSV